MPGGGAEIFSPRLAKLLHYTGKADPDRWCEIHGIAHALGIKTNATMLYGHVETLAERVDHLLRLREQQDASGGFLTFIPLAYQAGTTKLVPRQTPPTDSLRTIAASRLLLDNFPHIEAYWVMLGEETASLALHFGADDVNGTLEDEQIAHMAQAREPGRPRPRAALPHDPRRRQDRRSSATRSTTSCRSGTDVLDQDPRQGARTPAQRLDRDEGLWLLTEAPLLDVGALAQRGALPRASPSGASPS